MACLTLCILPGGAKGGVFFSKRYSAKAGLNSPNLDFLPVQNVEDMDTALGGLGAVPIGTTSRQFLVEMVSPSVSLTHTLFRCVEERNNEQMWRSASNGTESHTSAIDEYNIRQLLCRDAVEALERVSEKDKNVPLPSLGTMTDWVSLDFGRRYACLSNHNWIRRVVRVSSIVDISI
jgi:hypothetical protein